MKSRINDEIHKLLVRYRVLADGAYSDVKDGFYTQEEYERVLDKVGRRITVKIRDLIEEPTLTPAEIPEEYRV